MLKSAKGLTADCFIMGCMLNEWQLTVNDSSQGHKNISWLVKSLKHQHESVSKVSSHWVRAEKKVKEEKDLQILDSMQTVGGGGGGWSLCKLNGSAFFFLHLLLLKVVSCIFIRKFQPLCSWWWINPAGLIWSELVFYSFHLSQYPHLHHGPVSPGRP